MIQKRIAGGAGHVVLAVLFSGWLATSSTAVSAQPGVSANFFTVTGDGAGGTVTDWTISAFDSPIPCMGFAASGSVFQFYLMNDAPAGAASLGPNGLGIGFGSKHVSGPRFAAEALHVVGGGATDAYPRAHVLVQDRSPASEVRELLRLENVEGGGISVSLKDNGAGSAHYRFDNEDGRFTIRNETRNYIPFTAAPDAKLQMELAGNGCGLGTSSPTSKLHVFSDGSSPEAFSSTITSEVTSGAGLADRTALRLVNHGGTFMSFTDTSSNSTWFFSNKNDELFLKKSGVGSPGLRFLATGEARFVNGGSSLLRILPTGSCQATSFVSLSDRNVKKNIVPVDPAEVLERVANLPVSTWSYIKDESGARHIGPMAQDFYGAFGLGADDKTIAEMDRSGVALAAIQGLHGLVEQEAGEISELRTTVTGQAEQIEAQRDRIAELEARLERLEAMLPAFGDLPRD